MAMPENVSRLYPGATVVSSPEELLSHASDLDLIVLSAPAHTHRDLGTAAVAAGAAVVVDKPFAPSSADAQALIDASTQANRPLIVFQNRRWDGDFLTVRQLVESGRLGRIHRFGSTFERWSPTRKEHWQDRTTAATDAGITFDIGSYLIDQALVLFGPVTDLHAEMSPVRDGAVSEDKPWSDVAIRLGMLSGGNTERIPTLRGDYPAFYSEVAAAVRGDAAPPVHPHDALEVVRIIEWAHRVAASGGRGATVEHGLTERQCTFPWRPAANTPAFP